MYLKRGLVLIVFLLFVNVANSDVRDFQCKDGTMLGSCNSKGENLINNGKVDLENGEKYLFFGNGGCGTLKIGDKEIGLVYTGKRLVGQFTSNKNENVEVNCKDNNNLKGLYLGKLTGNLGLYKDCKSCGNCKEEILNCDYAELIGKHLEAKSKGKAKRK